MQNRKDGGIQNYDESYLRYVTLLAKIKNETAGGLLSSLANGSPCRLDRRHGEFLQSGAHLRHHQQRMGLIIIDKAHRVTGSSSDAARYKLYDAWGERRLDASYSKYFLTVFRETPKALAALVMLLQYFSHT